jgi:hypothetical protein
LFLRLFFCTFLLILAHLLFCCVLNNMCVYLCCHWRSIIKRRDLDLINLFSPVTFVCLSQVKIWSYIDLVLSVCIDYRREVVVRFVDIDGMVVNHCFFNNLDRDVHELWYFRRDFVLKKKSIDILMKYCFFVVVNPLIWRLQYFRNTLLLVHKTIYCRSSNDASYQLFN